MPTSGSNSEKNNWLKTMGAAVMQIKKSYRSMVVSSKLTPATVLVEAICSGFPLSVLSMSVPFYPFPEQLINFRPTLPFLQQIR